MGSNLARAWLLLGISAAGCFGKPPYPGAGSGDGGGGGGDGGPVGDGRNPDSPPPCMGSGCEQLLRLNRNIPPLTGGVPTRTKYSDVVIPVFFGASAANPALLANAADGSLRVLDAQGASLAYELESSSQGGEPVLWVYLGDLDPAGTSTISLTVDTGTSAAPPSAKSSYWGVWHLARLVSGESPNARGTPWPGAVAVAAPTVVRGRLGDALEIGAANQALAIASSSNSVVSPSALTVSCWARFRPEITASTAGSMSSPPTPSPPHHEETLFAQANAGGENIKLSFVPGYTVDGVVNPNYDQQVHARWGAGAYELKSGLKITDGEWHHVTYMNDGGVNKVLLVDGVVASDSMNATPVPTSKAAPFYVGARGGSTDVLDGAVDELRVDFRKRYVDELKLDFVAQSNQLITYP